MLRAQFVLIVPLLGIALVEGPCAAGGGANAKKKNVDELPKMTWFMMSQVGAQRETVPPLVFYVEGSKKIGTLDSPWSAQVTPDEMSKVHSFLHSESLKTRPQPGKDGEKASRRKFEAVFGDNGERTARFALTESAAKELIDHVRRELITSKDALKAASEFAKTFGW